MCVQYNSVGGGEVTRPRPHHTLLRYLQRLRNLIYPEELRVLYLISRLIVPPSGADASSAHRCPSLCGLMLLRSACVTRFDSSACFSVFLSDPLMLFPAQG